MSIETLDELTGMKRAGRLARMTLDALEASVRVGATTADLDAIAAQLFARHGARSAPTLVYGFPGHVLLSVNDEIVHGIPGARRLARGDLLKLDVTVECNGYIADAARTVVVGRDSEIGTRMIACVRAAFRAGVAVARAGTRVNEIGRAIEREVRRHGFAVVGGLSGHGVGRTIHEEPSVPNEYNALQKDVLTNGLVVTIEPLISAGSAEPVEDRDGWTIRTRDGSLAAHHEHTIMVTRGEPVVLTAL